MELLDRSISIVITFLLLSMISERIINWIKLQFGQQDKKLLGIKISTVDLTVKTSIKALEKEREKSILQINLVISIIIATLIKADFIQLIKASKPYETIGWDQVTWTAIIGIPLTGVFISLGSKFWHDLLDLLFFTKNIRQKISDSNLYESQSIDQLYEYLNSHEVDIVKLAIVQNQKELLEKFPSIRNLTDSVRIIGNQRKNVIGAYFIDDNCLGFPEKISVKLPGGRVYQIPTEVITNVGQVESSSLTKELEMDSGKKGSVCCIVKAEDENYLLTCCHVLTGKKYLNPGLNASGDVLYDGLEVGEWTFGVMSEKGDFALVKLNNKYKDIFAEDFQAIKFNNRTRKVVKDDCLRLQVQTTGCKSNVQNGYVVDVFHKEISVNYQGHLITFEEMISIGSSQDKENCLPLTKPGDSGGLVNDTKGNLIGVITAMDQRFTYVLPISKFFELTPYPKSQIV